KERLRTAVLPLSSQVGQILMLANTRYVCDALLRVQEPLPSVFALTPCPARQKIRIRIDDDKLVIQLEIRRIALLARGNKWETVRKPDILSGAIRINRADVARDDRDLGEHGAVLERINFVELHTRRARQQLKNLPRPLFLDFI